MKFAIRSQIGGWWRGGGGHEQERTGTGRGTAAEIMDGEVNGTLPEATRERVGARRERAAAGSAAANALPASSLLRRPKKRWNFGGGALLLDSTAARALPSASCCKPFRERGSLV